MNAALEKMLNELEASRTFGAVEIIYCDGKPVTLHIKRTLKMSGNPDIQRENREEHNGSRQTDSR
ncbi:MAG: hypothetical protein LAO19_19365 [Acidobacteriia bacterium]|nr:hypothetical protein [Terriglobia bacterium]